MGIDDESSHPELCSEVADGVTRNIVCLFREPDAGNPPVRFDEREQETELGQTGLRRVTRKRPTATGRLKPLRLFSTLLIERQLSNRNGLFPPQIQVFRRKTPTSNVLLMLSFGYASVPFSGCMLS